MEICIHTTVATNYIRLLDQFNSELFEALAPSFPRLRLLRFDGSHPGDIVEVELTAAGLSVSWSAKITERQVTQTEAWFTDEGLQLPWPLKKWKHRHLLTRLSENKSRITDHIFYSTGFWVTDQLIYPFLKHQFAKRVPVYKSRFGKV